MGHYYKWSKTFNVAKRLAAIEFSRGTHNHHITDTVLVVKASSSLLFAFVSVTVLFYRYLCFVVKINKET